MLFDLKKTICCSILLCLLPFASYSATTKTAGSGITKGQLVKFDAAGKVIPTTAATDRIAGVALQTKTANQSIAVEKTDDVFVNAEVGILKGEFLLPSASTAGAVQGSVTFQVGTFAVAETDESGGQVKADFEIAFPTMPIVGFAIPHVDTTGQTTDDHHTQSHVISGGDHTGTVADVQLSSNVALLDTAQNWTANQTFPNVGTGMLFAADAGFTLGTAPAYTMAFNTTLGHVGLVTLTGGEFELSSLTGQMDFTMNGLATIPDIDGIDSITSGSGDLVFDDAVSANRLTFDIDNTDGPDIISNTNLLLNVGINDDLTLFDSASATNVNRLLQGGWGTSSQLFLGVDVGNALVSNVTTFSILDTFLVLTSGGFDFANTTGVISLNGDTVSTSVANLIIPQPIEGAFGDTLENNATQKFIFENSAATKSLLIDLVQTNVTLAPNTSFLGTTKPIFFSGAGGNIGTVAGPKMEFKSSVGEVITMDWSAAFTVLDFGEEAHIIAGGATEIRLDSGGTPGVRIIGDLLGANNTVVDIGTAGLFTIEEAPGGDSIDINLALAGAVSIDVGTDVLQLQREADGLVSIFANSTIGESRELFLVGWGGAAAAITWFTMNVGGVADNDIDFIAKALDGGVFNFTTDNGTIVLDGTTITGNNGEDISFAVDDKVRIVEDLGVKYVEFDLTGVNPIITSNTGVVSIPGLTLAHSATTGQTVNDHHNQVHAIDGADHTGSLDDNEIVSLFSGTNHMDTATNVDEALIDLDGAIGAVNYFSGVDVAGAIDVSAGWTDITLDTEHAKSGITHAADSAVVTIDTTGTYVVSYHLTLDDSNDENQGYTGEGRLMLDTGAGFAEVSGTRTAFVSFFDPSDATPMGTCSMSVILSLTATDDLKLQGQQNPISSDTGILTNPDGCGLTIHSL